MCTNNSNKTQGYLRIWGGLDDARENLPTNVVSFKSLNNSFGLTRYSLEQCMEHWSVHERAIDEYILRHGVSNPSER